MVFKVGVGKSDFEALRKSNNYYVDKTMFNATGGKNLLPFLNNDGEILISG